MGHIFISYKSDERELAELVRQKLIDWHYTTWMDVHDIPAGEDWNESINQAISKADRVVAIMTPKARASYPVRCEWETAIAKNKFLPLLFEKCPPHWLFDGIQRIDFTADREPAFDILKTRLADPLPSSDEKRAAEPFYDYLQTLFDQIDQSLRTRMIATLRDERGAPTPIPLRSETTADAVAASRPMLIDPLFVSASKEDEEKRTFTDFRGAFEHYKGRLLLLGEPGAGKTITLLHFAREAVLRRLQDPTAPLPILRSIVMWDVYQRPPLDAWVGDAYQNSALADEIRSGHALLLLDGLDELGSERPVDPDKPDGEKFDPRQRFLETIAALVGAHRDAPLHTQILVTCRPKDYAQIGQKIVLKGAVTLQPLDDAQIAAYLHAQPELLKAIMADDKLREVAQTPLLLSIFGFVYEGMSESERDALANLKQAGDIRDKIFNAYIDERYKHEERKLALRGETMPFSLAEVRAILTRLAYRNIRDSEATANVITLYDLVRDVDLEQVERERIEAFIKLSLHLNLLALDSENHPGKLTYRFIHLLLRDTLAFPQGMTDLHNNDKSVRRNATAALGQIGDGRAVDGLLMALRDGDRDIRRNAAAALGSVADPRALDGLLTALHDEGRDVRSSTAYALGQIGDIRALDGLLTALRDENMGVRYSAAAALGSVADPRALDGLLIALCDGDWNVRMSAATALGQIGDARALDGLLTALCNDNRPYVRGSAAISLAKLGVRAIDELLVVLHNGDWDARCSAAIALGQIGDARALDGLLDAIGDDDQYFRDNATIALSKLGGLGLDRLMETLHNDFYTYARRRAAIALGRISDARALDGLIIALRDKDDVVRSGATFALREIGDARAVEALLAALGDNDEYVRSSAADALGEIGDARAVGALLASLNDSDNGVRGSGAKALGQIGDARAVEALLAALEDSSDFVLRSAADALGAIADAHALDGLLVALRGENRDVRSLAADALEQIGTFEALIPLECWRREQQNKM